MNKCRYGKPMISVAISVPPDTLPKIDKKAKEKGMSRSEYILALIKIAEPFSYLVVPQKKTSKDVSGGKWVSKARKQRQIERERMGMNKSQMLQRWSNNILKDKD